MVTYLLKKSYQHKTLKEVNFKDKPEISVASGVVIDSNAVHEFNENYIKAKSLMDLYK